MNALHPPVLFGAAENKFGGAGVPRPFPSLGMMQYIVL